MLNPKKFGMKPVASAVFDIGPSAAVVTPLSASKSVSAAGDITTNLSAVSTLFEFNPSAISKNFALVKPPLAVTVVDGELASKASTISVSYALAVPHQLTLHTFV